MNWKMRAKDLVGSRKLKFEEWKKKGREMRKKTRKKKQK